MTRAARSPNELRSRDVAMPGGDVKSAGICVVGMHRSGTSLTMGVLRRLGLDIGSDESLVPASAEDNPDGYLEQRAFVELDDELLAALGGHTSDPGPAPLGWHAEERFAAQHVRGRDLVMSTFDRVPWGWKDPRAALLLPFWRAVVPGLRVVICLRNPAEVAASMMQRHAHPSREHWLRMWLRYTADALRDSTGAPRIGLVYEDLLADPEREARKLGAFLLGADPADELVRTAAEPVLPGRRRHSVSDAALVRDPLMPAEVAAAYLALRTAARTDSSLHSIGPLATGLNAALGRREGSSALLDSSRREQELLAAELQRVRAQHAVVVSSRSWRLTAPLRSMAHRIRGGRR